MYLKYSEYYMEVCVRVRARMRVKEIAKEKSFIP